MPNGVCLVWGAWGGTEHDATMLAESGVLETLRQIAEHLSADFTGFGDSVYPLHSFMQRILKAPPGGSLSPLQRCHNAVMARFRIVIEQCFAETSKTWALLQHRHNLLLGSMQVGKMFLVAMVLFNLRSLLYGNITSS